MALNKPTSELYPTGIFRHLSYNFGATQIKKFTVLQYAKKAATLEIAINGFQRTGIEPYNPHILSDIVFAPACVSERPLSAGRTETEDADWNSSGDEPLINLQIPPTNTKIITDGDGPTNATPGPSCVGNDTMHFRSPWQIRALPKYDQPTSNTRKKQKCSILTSTPVKEQR
ncbi:hypothetical protein QE152_g38290 [Popillia japonica]|uniref:Uncharacterized protein n=1 Tax=Popillia japonica TaxID=7064 RepID=A0AAW1I8B8_POPJA